MNLKEMGINTRNWVDSPQDRNYWRALVNAALMDLKEIGINTRNWIDSDLDMDYWRVLVYAALNLRVHGVS